VRRAINSLNEFLKGNYMAIHAYNEYINRAKQPELKLLLQQLQQNHQQHAMEITKRIQDLGGKPVDHPGIKGKSMEIFKMLTDHNNEPDHIVKDALAGEKRGIEISQNIVNGTLDDQSYRLVQQILDKNIKHLDLLNQALHDIQKKKPIDTIG
jgi:Protein distantly related to bacterial ferritins